MSPRPGKPPKSKCLCDFQTVAISLVKACPILLRMRLMPGLGSISAPSGSTLRQAAQCCLARGWPEIVLLNYSRHTPLPAPAIRAI